MPEKRIDFGPRLESGAEEMAGAQPSAFNVVIDTKGAVLRRPGLVAYGSAPSSALETGQAVDLVHVANNGELYAAVGPGPSRTMYRVVPGGGVNLGTPIGGSGRPTVAETEALLVITAGQEPRKVSLSADTCEFLGGTPPTSSHVIANASRLLLNNNFSNLNRVSYSGVATGGATAGHEEWTPGVEDAGFFSAEARPDPVLALKENTNEVFAFGRSTLQVYRPGGGAFTYAEAASREHGVSAPYSIVNWDQAFVWLDHKRRVILSDGRSVETISTPIKQTLDDIADVSDGFGYRVVHGPVDAYVLSFVEDARTFAWGGGGWSQWASWDNESNNWAPFPVRSYHQRTDDSVHVVGLSDGRIAEMDRRAKTDLGVPIYASVTTGFQDHGTGRRKRSKSIKLFFRRGRQAAGSGVAGWLSFRDHSGGWDARLPVDLGEGGDTTPEVEFRCTGVYRTREWKYEFAGDSDLTLAKAVEEYEVLGS